MKISKTLFMNYARCPRFSALDEIYREKDKAVVAFSEDPELDELISLENREKVQILKEKMYSDDEDFIEIKDPQMEIMLPYYNQIEMQVGQIVRSRYEGEVVYNLETYKQKRFSFHKDGFEFYCFLDGYQEDENAIRIFEVKATTSKKFTKLTYTDDDKNKIPLFGESPEGILMLQEELGTIVNHQYHMTVQKLMKRLDKVGRYIYDIAYQRYVIESSFETKKPISYYLVVLNANYIHQGKLDEKTHPMYEDDMITFIDVTKLTQKMMPLLDLESNKVIQYLNQQNASPTPLGEYCQRKDSRQCKFYPICYNHIPEKNSLFVYLDGHHGFKDLSGNKYERFDLINDGYIQATDIPYEWLNREKNVIQRNVIDSKIPFIDAHKIKQGIQTLKYPIYHLDFETFPCPVPRFFGEKPYSQSLFQYSIHIEHAPGVCDKDNDNYSFIATSHHDMRRDLIEKMLDVIKDDDGTILVYNQSFEQTRLKEMAEIFPEYKNRLLNMIDRLFDLMDLVKGNTKLYTALGLDKDHAARLNYYHEDLNGSYSIKKVLPIFSNLTYTGLDIANGVDALVAYAKFPLMEKDVFEKTYRHLLEYCKQDTWAMVVILDQLRNI